MQLDVIICSSTLSSCQSASRWHEALLLLRHMCQIRVQLDVVAYSSAIASCDALASGKLLCTYFIAWRLTDCEQTVGYSRQLSQQFKDRSSGSKFCTCHRRLRGRAPCKVLMFSASEVR